MFILHNNIKKFRFVRIGLVRLVISVLRINNFICKISILFSTLEHYFRVFWTTFKKPIMIFDGFQYNSVQVSLLLIFIQINTIWKRKLLVFWSETLEIRMQRNDSFGFLLSLRMNGGHLSFKRRGYNAFDIFHKFLFFFGFT
eukprot:NODE_11_length_54881_cov_1.430718.p35 type:complete len:142 gc:universal NODE_11_length_54881_cov_1.430718:41176-40751(-)